MSQEGRVGYRKLGEYFTGHTFLFAVILTICAREVIEARIATYPPGSVSPFLNLLHQRQLLNGGSL